MNKLHKLQEIITDKDDTHMNLANEIGCNNNQIRRWINGEAEMGIWKLKKICEYYKVSADYILGLEKGLEYPREEERSKRRNTPNCTKYTFLYNGLCCLGSLRSPRQHRARKNSLGSLRSPREFFIVTECSAPTLPKNVIETRCSYRCIPLFPFSY